LYKSASNIVILQEAIGKRHREGDIEREREREIERADNKNPRQMPGFPTSIKNTD
jgi:hypothetical protein